MARAGHLGVGLLKLTKKIQGNQLNLNFKWSICFFSFSVSTSPEIHTKNYYYNYLKFKFNWIPCILSGNPTWSYLLRCSVVLVISQSWRGRDWEWHWEGWEDEKGGTHPQPILQNRTEAQVTEQMKEGCKFFTAHPLESEPALVVQQNVAEATLYNFWGLVRRSLEVHASVSWDTTSKPQLTVLEVWPPWGPLELLWLTVQLSSAFQPFTPRPPRYGWSCPGPYSSSCMCVRMLSHLTCIRLFVSLWTIACQASLSVGFSRQEYWSGLPWPSPGYLPNPGIEPMSLRSPALAGGFFTTSATGKTSVHPTHHLNTTDWSQLMPWGPETSLS